MVPSRRATRSRRRTGTRARRHPTPASAAVALTVLATASVTIVSVGAVWSMRNSASGTPTRCPRHPSPVLRRGATRRPSRRRGRCTPPSRRRRRAPRRPARDRGCRSPQRTVTGPVCHPEAGASGEIVSETVGACVSGPVAAVADGHGRDRSRHARQCGLHLAVDGELAVGRVGGGVHASHSTGQILAGAVVVEHAHAMPAGRARRPRRADGDRVDRVDLARSRGPHPNGGRRGHGRARRRCRRPGSCPRPRPARP